MRTCILLAILVISPILRTRIYGGWDLEADIALKTPRIYRGISSTGCAQAVTLADNQSLTMVWQKQVDDGWGCGACVEEWKLTSGDNPIQSLNFLFQVVDPKNHNLHGWVSHDFTNKQSTFKSGLRVYPSCIGDRSWGVWHAATAEQ